MLEEEKKLFKDFKVPPFVALEDAIAKGLIDPIPGWDPHHWMIEEKEE